MLPNVPSRSLARFAFAPPIHVAISCDRRSRVQTVPSFTSSVHLRAVFLCYGQVTISDTAVRG